MKLKLGLLRKRLANGESGLFDAIAGQLDASIELTRTLVWELSPPTLYTLGLVPAAEWLGEKLTESHAPRTPEASLPFPRLRGPGRCPGPAGGNRSPQAP